MNFPEQLYLPTAYDYATGIAPRRYFENVDINFTGTNLQSRTSFVPPNRALQVTHLFCSAGPISGVAELLLRFEVRVIQEGNPELILGELVAIQDSINGLTARQQFGGLIALLMLPGEALAVFAEKNGAAATFRLTLSVQGFLVPRANIQSG